MKITFYGHSGFLIEINGVRLLFDPFISPNENASHINVEEIEADFILLSHGHADHVADAADIAKRTDALLISNFEVISWFQNQGIENVLPMNHGGTIRSEFGSVKYVNAVHSSTMPDGSPGGNPGGFVVETPEGNFYYSGDTALTYDMKLIGSYHNIDVAFLCIGDHFTMGVSDAVIAADFVACDTIVGMHYDTFPPITIDKEAAAKAFSDAGKTLHLPEIGTTIEL